MSFARQKAPCAERAQPQRAAPAECSMSAWRTGKCERLHASRPGHAAHGRISPPPDPQNKTAGLAPADSLDRCAHWRSVDILWKTVSGRDEASLLRLPSRAPLFFCACVPLRRASPGLLRLRLLLRFRRRIALSPVVPLQAHAGWVGSFEFRSSRNPVQSRP